MRNISQFAISLILLASQVHIPLLSDVAASAESDDRAGGVYEVSLQTNTASGIAVVGPKQPNFDTEVLDPLHAAQAAKAAAASKKKVRKVVARPVVTVQVSGSHADWM